MLQKGSGPLVVEDREYLRGLLGAQAPQNLLWMPVYDKKNIQIVAIIELSSK